jgi:transcriptional regulator with XRE-family HTH domain
VTQSLGDTIAAQIRRYRRIQNLSIRELAEECARLAPEAAGPTAASLANIERGQDESAKRRRRDITAEELLIIAAALRVPPAALMFPIDQGDELEALAGGAALTRFQALSWLNGEIPYPIYDETAERDWRRNAEPLRRFRTYEEVVDIFIEVRNEAREKRDRMADLSNEDGMDERSEARRKSLQAWIKDLEEDMATAAGQIVKQRAGLEQAGITPPALPPEVAADLAAFQVPPGWRRGRRR